MKQISKNLKTERKKIGISQEELAKELNMTRRAYSSYEYGECEPSIDTLILLANRFKITIDELVGRLTKTQTN